MDINTIDICILRGWSFTEGIDDMETECGLDDLKHDVVIDNSETDKGEHLIKKLCTDVIEPMLRQ